PRAMPRARERLRRDLPARSADPVGSRGRRSQSGWKKTRRMAARPCVRPRPASIPGSSAPAPGAGTPRGRAEDMFTGIIQGIGSLASREMREGDARLRIAFGTLPCADIQPGESIAVNGVCLTVVAFDAASFQADASNETLALTTLGTLESGAM